MLWRGCPLTRCSERCEWRVQSELADAGSDCPSYVCIINWICFTRGYIYPNSMSLSKGFLTYTILCNIFMLGDVQQSAHYTTSIPAAHHWQWFHPLHCIPIQNMWMWAWYSTKKNSVAQPFPNPVFSPFPLKFFMDKGSPTPRLHTMQDQYWTSC